MNAPPKTFWFDQAYIGALAVATALALWFSFPPSPVVFNDDFGYFRSVLATLQHGRPWTDEFLEPWTCSLSALSALIFKTTGNFRLATYGLTAALAGAAVVFGMKILRHRGASLLSAALWVLVMLSCPTVLRKLAEFSAIPMYLASLLGALWFAERKNWTLFVVCWVVAFSSRQSALFWLALPAGMLIETTAPVLKEWIKTSAKIVGIGLAGGFMYFVMTQIMNPTQAQTTTMPDIVENLSMSLYARRFAIALAAFFAASGLGAFVLRTASGRPIARPTWMARFLSILGCLAAPALWGLDAQQYVVVERILFTGDRGITSLKLLGGLSVVGWLWAVPSIRFRYLACGLAMGALVGLRPTIWDYYLIDSVVFGLFSVALPASTELRSPAWFVRAVGFAVAGMLLWINGAFVQSTKGLLDFYYAKVFLVERALRAGEIRIVDVTAAPFGYRGWHLHPYFIANDSRPGRAISYFRLYVRDDATWCRPSDPESPLPTIANGGLRKGEAVVVSYVFPTEWTKAVRYTLFRTTTQTPPPVSMDPAKYSFEPFPLNNDEWRKYLRKPGQ